LKMFKIRKMFKFGRKMFETLKCAFLENVQNFKMFKF
jgi:hypothetical protein